MAFTKLLFEYPPNVRVSWVLALLNAIPLLMDEPLLIVKELNAPVGSVPPKVIAVAELEFSVPELVIFAAPFTLIAAANKPVAVILPALLMVTAFLVLVTLIASEPAPEVVMPPLELLVIELTPEVEFN